MSANNYKLITSVDDLSQVVAALNAAPAVGLDTETTGLDPHTSRLRLLQLATPEITFIIDLFRFAPEQLAPLWPLLIAPQPSKIAHNAKFDAKFLLRHCGVRLGGIYDTYLASVLISAGNENDRHGLEAVAARYLDVQMDKAAQLSDWSGELSEYQLEYAARDAQVLLPLRERLQARLEELDLLVTARLEFECVLAVAGLELAGVYVDAARWREVIKRVRAEHEIIADELQRELAAGAAQLSLFGDIGARVNLDSPTQVKEALARLGITIEDTREWTLRRTAVEHPLIEKLLQHRSLSKSLSSYGENILEFINPATGRIHADFRQLGTPTGRLTTSAPSLQQIPHTVEYRSCFRAPEGRKLVIADFSQIEMRILADFSKDQALLAAFDSGADLHRMTAAQMYNLALDEVTPRQRESAKALNYGLVYGMGAEGLAVRIKSSVPDAEALMRKYFQAYAGVARWLREAGERATREGRARTAAGRLWIFQLDPNDRSQAAALRRIGKNAPIQGTSSDIFKRAMTLLDEALRGRDAQIVNSIHDELVVECDEAIAAEVKPLVAQAMIAGAQEFLARVPVNVEAVIADVWLKK